MIDFDDSQLRFVRSNDQNIRLLAPAGCGKTISLLYRCRALLEQSSGPQRFLLLTFTNAAASEIRERLEADHDFAGLQNAVRTTTLNSWGWRRLRDHHSRSKLLNNPDARFLLCETS